VNLFCKKQDQDCQRKKKVNVSYTEHKKSPVSKAFIYFFIVDGQT
jgi:hypothetical protein